VGVKVGVTYSRNKFAVRTYIHTKFKYESQFSIFDSFRDSRVHTNDFLKFMGGLWALEWAWHLALRKKLRNPHAKSQYPSSYSFRDLIVHTDRQTDGQTDMSRSTILKFPIPNFRFLGLTGYYRKYVQNCAKIAKPLTKYLKGRNGKVSKKCHVRLQYCWTIQL